MKKQKAQKIADQMGELLDTAQHRAEKLLKFTRVEEVPTFFEMIDKSSVELDPLFATYLDESMRGVKKNGESVLGENYSLNPRKWIGEEVADAVLKLYRDDVLSNIQYDVSSAEEFAEKKFEVAKEQAKDWQSEKGEELRSNTESMLDNAFPS